MKTKPNQAVREVRCLLEQTQSEFAAMIGVTRDAVVNWELGRSRLSRKFGRRIALATGAEEKGLLSGRGPVTTYVLGKGHVPFTPETFAEHRKSYWGRTDETAARHHYRNCADALELLFVAAARSSDGKSAGRLPAVVDSFVVWCREIEEEFQLDMPLRKLLAERKSPQPITMSYRRWREKQKEDPAVCRTWGFKDDPKKDDNESLTLVAELSPVWRPGYYMRGKAGGEGKGEG